MPSLTSDQIAEARVYRRDDMTWAWIGRQFGCTSDTVRAALNPEWARRRQDRINIMRRGRDRKSYEQRKPPSHQRVFFRPPMIAGTGVMDLPPDTSPCAVALIDLQDHHCRWPLADGTFCGAFRCDDRKLEERGACAYCDAHSLRAYAK